MRGDAPGCRTIPVPPARFGRVGAATQQKCQWQHDRDRNQADADMRLAPADDLDGFGQNRRPDGTGQIVATGADGDGDATALLKPKRHIGDQRAERRGATHHADQQRLHQREGQDAFGLCGRDIADAEHQRADQQRDENAEAVSESSHDDAADRKTDHGRGIGYGRAATVDAELRFDGGQRDDHRPQADAADRAHGQRRGKPPPGI